MADTSKPQDDLSIEEILGSIRRIIAEDEDDDAAPAAAAPLVQADASAKQDIDPVPTIIMEDDPENEEPLELTNRIEPDGAITPVADEIRIDTIDVMEISMEDEPIELASIDADRADDQQETQPEPAPVVKEEKPVMTTQEDTLPKDNSLLSSNTAIATAAVMAKLARQAAITEEGNGNVTIEAMVKEMIRPMLREWLDSNLPDLVQKMVERELERLTKRL